MAMKSIELFLSVPMGLEDVVVRKLPSSLCEVATEIHYGLGSGYVIVVLPAIGIHGKDSQDVVIKALSDLVDHPPLCIFSAHVALGSIQVPRTTFKDPAGLLAFAKQKLRLSRQPSMPLAHPSPAPPLPLTTATAATSAQSEEKETMLHWEEALAVLKFVSPPSFSDRVYGSSPTENDIDKEQSPVRFRASFDRGDIQHKGVRSQDIAAALGSLTGDRFPEWKVNLTEFDVEVIGRWIQDVEETDRVYFKEASTSQSKKRTRADDDDDGGKARAGATRQSEADLQIETESKRMQVGITLPLALSTCPYRFRPKDGRTSLRMEIAYTLIGLADPKPGDIVLDTCAGVGTIPIIGAAHYPQCLFLSSELLPPNVEKAHENSLKMMERVDLVRIEQRQHQQISDHHSRNTRSHSRPGLILGDAKAVCLRSNSVDLVISDLPWGQRESSHLSNCKLYPRLIKEVIRVLRSGGRAVLVTGERKLLQRQLDAPFAKPYLKVVRKREITIGFKVIVFELVRL